MNNPIYHQSVHTIEECADLKMQYLSNPKHNIRSNLPVPSYYDVYREIMYDIGIMLADDENYYEIHCVDQAIDALYDEIAYDIKDADKLEKRNKKWGYVDGTYNIGKDKDIIKTPNVPILPKRFSYLFVLVAYTNTNKILYGKRPEQGGYILDFTENRISEKTLFGEEEYMFLIENAKHSVSKFDNLSKGEEFIVRADCLPIEMMFARREQYGYNVTYINNPETGDKFDKYEYLQNRKKEVI